MGTWLTYAPGDFLMFGPEVYWRLFELQNRALWPLPVIAALAGLGALLLVATRRPVAIRGALILAALACLGAVHFLATRYAPINWLAAHAAWAFGLQAVVLVALAARGGDARFEPSCGVGAVMGWGLLGYATLLHPLAGLAFGRPLTQAQIFGIAPDSTALACLGLLILVRPGSWSLACSVIPFLWCVFSAMTLLTLGDPQGVLMTAMTLLWLVGRAADVFRTA